MKISKYKRRNTTIQCWQCEYYKNPKQKFPGNGVVCNEGNRVFKTTRACRKKKDKLINITNNKKEINYD